MQAASAVQAACGGADPNGSSPDPAIQAEAARLLGVLGHPLAAHKVFPQPLSSHPSSCAVLRWAGWGAMNLTGMADGPPLAPTPPVATRVAGLTLALTTLTEQWGTPVGLPPGELLTARAREAGWSRNGLTSANGTAHLLRGREGWLVVNLARPSDLEVLPAAMATVVADSVETGIDPLVDPLAALTGWARCRSPRSAADALQELGIPAAALGQSARIPAVESMSCGLSRSGLPSHRVPVVIDLSAMWAGPLASRIMARAGAAVITVEDLHRPDGARTGPAGFYAALHQDREHVQLDFTTSGGRAALHDLLAGADIVIESSRPRAMRQLGVIAEDFVAARAGRTWLSITGYGRRRFGGNRVAFGDDAAVAAGLVGYDAEQRPMFCADAIADPLTGVHAALAVIASQLLGGGELLDVAMAGVCADVARAVPGQRTYSHRTERTPSGWSVRHEDEPAHEVIDSPIRRTKDGALGPVIR